jgi:hypothetical protein
VLAGLLVAACAIARGAAAAEPGDAAVAPSVPAADRHPDLTRLSPTAEIWVDRVRKEVVVGATVVLDEGPIEVFACPAGTKEHEAVVATKAPGRLIHAALLAIGLDPGGPVSFRPDYTPAHGAKVAVRARWRDSEGVARESRAQDWIRNATTGEPLAADWVFAGSSLWRDPQDGTTRYEADGGDLICVSNFPTAMLDLPIESSQANDELLFEVFAGRVPPRGTAVDLVLGPLGPDRR